MNTIYFFVILSLLFLGCGTKASMKNSNNKNQNPTDFVIIKYDSTLNWIFQHALPTELQQNEIDLSMEIIHNCLIEHNSKISPSSKKTKEIILKDYFIQLVPILNGKSEKEVWVNCFCNAINEDWKDQIVYVLDGGKCYFNLKINLTTKDYYDFQVNGEA